MPRAFLYFLLVTLHLNVFSYAEYVHGLALHGTVKYKPDAKKLDYTSVKAKKGGVLDLAVIGTFDSLNPYVVKGHPAAGLQMLHSGIHSACLMHYPNDEPFSGYGYVAESMEFTADKKSITFKLREKATFHDGSRITPEDIIFSHQALLKEGHPFFKNYFGVITRVEKIDDFTVRFHFKDDQNKELHLIIGQMPILSKAYYDKYDLSDANLTPPMGNGPYKIKHVDPGRKITYEREKDWWGDDLWFNRYRYSFDEIHYQYFRDDNIAFEAFKSGEMTYRVEPKVSTWVEAYNFPAIKSGEIVKNEMRLIHAGRMTGLAMNTRKLFLSDIRVRKALTYAFDFEWLNENLFHNLYERITSYFWGLELASSVVPHPDNITLPKSDGSGRNRANLLQARDFLQQAGYVIKGGKLISPHTKEPISLEILVKSSSTNKVLGPFVKNLKRLGIESSIRIVDASQYQSRIESFDFDLILQSVFQSDSPGNEQREFWSTKAASATGSRNYAGVSDPNIDEVIEELIDADSRIELVNLTRKLDRLLLAGYYYIPFYGRQTSFFAHQVSLKFPKAPSYGSADPMSWWIEPKQ